MEFRAYRLRTKLLLSSMRTTNYLTNVIEQVCRHHLNPTIGLRKLADKIQCSDRCPVQWQLISKTLREDLKSSLFQVFLNSKW